MQVVKAKASRGLGVLAASALLAGLLVSCSNDEQGTTAARSDGVEPSSTVQVGGPENLTDASARPCSLLTTQQIAELLGESVGGRGIYEDEYGLISCRVGSVPGLGVEVGAVPASEWAQVYFPDLLQDAGPALQAQPAALASLTAAADAVRRGEEVSDDEACEVFRTVSTAFLGPSSATAFVSALPDSQAPKFLDGQTCRNGVYATLTVARPGITASSDDVAAVTRALASVVDYVVGD